LLTPLLRLPPASLTLLPVPLPLWLAPLRPLSMPLLPSKHSTENEKAASRRLFFAFFLIGNRQMEMAVAAG